MIAAAVLALIAAASPSVGLDEHPGAAVPRDLRFLDTRGHDVRLSDVTDGEPTVLIMAYARCTMLCSVVLRGVGDAVKTSSLTPGRDFHLVIVSLDPTETIDEAARKQAALVERIGKTGDRDAWPYLVGAPSEVARLAAALGFHYRWDARTQQYAHPAVVFVLTPDGRIAEYLRGVTYPDLDAAIRRAGAGVITAPTAHDLITCFHFDPALRAYQARLALYFRIGAGVVFTILTSLIVALLLWERRRRRRTTWVS